MKNSQKGSAVVILSIIIVLLSVVLGTYMYFQSKIQSNDTYTFKSVKKNNDGFLPNITVEIYKSGNLLKSIPVGSGTGADSFTLSPDNSYVALGLGYYGGSCVGGDNLVVLSLSSLSIIKPNLVNRLNWHDTGIQSIENIKWNSNSEVETTIQFGDKNSGCGVMATGTAVYSISQ